MRFLFKNLIFKILEVSFYCSDAFENNYGVLILRNGTDGFDLSEEFIRLDVKDVNALRKSCTIISMSADAAGNEENRPLFARFSVLLSLF